MAPSKAARAGFNKWKNKNYGANDSKYGAKNSVALNQAKRPMFY